MFKVKAHSQAVQVISNSRGIFLVDQGEQYSTLLRSAGGLRQGPLATWYFPPRLVSNVKYVRRALDEFSRKNSTGRRWSTDPPSHHQGMVYEQEIAVPFEGQTVTLVDRQGNLMDTATINTVVHDQHGDLTDFAAARGLNGSYYLLAENGQWHVDRHGDYTVEFHEPHDWQVTTQLRIFSRPHREDTVIYPSSVAGAPPLGYYRVLRLFPGEVVDALDPTRNIIDQMDISGGRGYNSRLYLSYEGWQTHPP